MPRIVIWLCVLWWLAGPVAAIGVETLRRHPDGTDVALVFVHGLGGGPCSSFESGSAVAKEKERIFACPEQEPRPAPASGRAPVSWFTIIERDGSTPLPGGRTMGDVDLYSLGYLDAARGSMSVTEIGERLASDDEFLKILDDYNHVLFVAHSMGGIVVRRAIVRVELSSARARLDRIAGVALLGSPSEGAPLADQVTDIGCSSVPIVGPILRFFSSGRGKACWGELAARWFGAGWHQISDLRTLDGHNHLLRSLQTDWGGVLQGRHGKPFLVSCGYETVPEVGIVNVTVVERLYTSTPGCLELVPLNERHTDLPKPTGVSDDRHQWLRKALITALQQVEAHKEKVWSDRDPLGHLIDQIEAEGAQTEVAGRLVERIGVGEGSRKFLQRLRLRPQTRGYGGPTYGALIKSIAASNSCVLAKLDRRRRQIELSAEGAVECRGASPSSGIAYACDERYC